MMAGRGMYIYQAMVICVLMLFQPIPLAAVVVQQPYVPQNMECAWSGRVKILSGLQTVVPQTQPFGDSIGVEVEVSLSNARLTCSLAGISTNPFGSVSLSIALPHVFETIAASIDIKSTLPSWVLSVNPWFGLVLGQYFDDFSWSLGVQAGLLLPVMPNQRPVGPSLMTCLLGTFSVSPFSWFMVSMEGAWAFGTGSLIPSIAFRAHPLTCTFSFPCLLATTPSGDAVEIMHSRIAASVTLDVGGIK